MFELSREEFLEITSKICFYCNQFSEGKDHCGVGRVLSDLGYTKENCVPCCTKCSVAKNDLSLDGFVARVESIYYNLTRALNPNVTLGENCTIPNPQLNNLYGCKIGNNCKIGAFTEIQSGVVIGNNCKIQSFVFIPNGVIIEDGVFVGPKVTFTNDKNPRAVGDDGELLKNHEWTLTPTLIKKGASIGANSTILCGVTIGEGAMVGAGSVVTKNVAAGTTVFGNPAKVRGN